MNGLISDLQILIRQPSVSARKQGLNECASLVASIMNKAGISTELLYLDYDGDRGHSRGYHSHLDDDRGNNNSNNNNNNNNNNDVPPPIVYGEVKSKANADVKNILFYNHYDVRPEEPIELWKATISNISITC